CVRRPFPHRLVADPDRDRQVRHGHHETRQPRGRRHPRAPGPVAPETGSRSPHRPWTLRGRPALRRRREHSDHLRAERRRRARGHGARTQAHRGAATLFLLLLLFIFQRYGTARVGGVFGPIMLAWFTTIGILGAVEIARAPAILLALNPWYAVQV